MLRGRFAVFAPLAMGFFLHGCAEGGQVEDGSGGGGGADPTTDAATTSSTTASTTAATTGSGSGGAGGGGTTAATTSTGQVCDFASLDTCATADPMPPIAGDEDGSYIETGVGEAWFKIHIEERDSSIGGEDMSYRVTLTSPPGMDYDLDVQEGPQAGMPSCTATIKNGAGTPEVVQASWSDEQGFGGVDDSLWLVIHVVYVSGDACGPGDDWTLSIEGHI